jgi:hypothetical protein
MTGKSGARRHGTTDDATKAAVRWSLRRLFRSADDPDRSSRRAGSELFPVVVATPRVWAALG